MVGVFFNGNKLVTPTTASRVDVSAMQDTNVAGANTLVIIGKATGGKPQSVLSFGGPEAALATLRGGELCDAVVSAFSPSEDTGAPGTVLAVRVDPATQASLTLKNGTDADVITLTSVNYGLLDNQAMVKVEDGTDAGKMLTWFDGETYLHDDNVGKDVLSIQYAGAASSATVLISKDTLTLTLDAAPTAIDLNTYKTVADVANKINTLSGFTATVLNGAGTDVALGNLDFVTVAADVKTAAYTVTADLKAVVDWFNNVAGSVITAVKIADAGTLPANIGYTSLSGGTIGVSTTEDWTDALTLLQAEDVQWLAACSGDASIRAMVDAHCLYCTNTLSKERRAVLGTGLATSDADAILAAKSLNSKRSSLVHIGHYQYNAVSGLLELRPAYMTAVLIAAGFAGMDPGNAMSNKTLKVQGLERKLLNPTDTDKLLLGGVLPIEDTPQGYKVTQSITSWLGDGNYVSREQSCGFALDYTVRASRDALDVLRGQKQGPLLLSRAVAITETTLKQLAKAEPEGPGILSGDAASPAYRNITASISGDVLAVQYECSPVIPNNYILVTVYAKPYSGTATA